MDPGSEIKFDSHYYTILYKNKGLFQSDAALLTDKSARKVALKLMNRETFFSKFAVSMKKMGAIEVLTGKSGEIRKHCAVVNN